MARTVHDRAEPARPDSVTATGIDVFISHGEEDGAVALGLADALESAGYSTWCSERDIVPGPSYLLQTSRAVASSRTVVVLISADALGSHQVTSEVVRAHEEGKPFIPLLVGISREEFGARQPEWREAIGSAATLELPERGVSAVVPRIVDGLVAIGVRPHEAGVAKPKPTFVEPSRIGPMPEPVVGPGRRRRRWLWPLVGFVGAALVTALVLVIVLQGGGSGPASNPSTSTAVHTEGGLARVTARIDTQFCAIGGGICQTAPAGRVFLFLDLVAWRSGSLAFDDKVSASAFQAHVTVKGVGYTATEVHSTESGGTTGFTVVFPSLPESIAGSDVELRWPGNGPIQVRVGR